MKYLLLILSLSCFISVIKTEEIVDDIESRTFLETIYMKLDDKVKDLTTQLAISQEQIKHLESKVNGLTKTNEQQNLKIDQQKLIMDQLSLKIDKQSTTIDQQKSIIDHQNSKIGQQVSIIDHLKKEVHSTKEDVKLLKNQQNELKSK